MPEFNQQRLFHPLIVLPVYKFASSIPSRINSMMENPKAAAYASSSSSRDARTYDVFLSFRGEDTRNGFVSHLYAALGRKSIYTFKDDEKFATGRPVNEIIQTINESKISIVVLSQNFANSSWCLDELVRILECKDVKNQEVIPIFYNVDISHVKKQEGSFGKAFADLQSKLLSRKRQRDETLEASVDDNGDRVQNLTFEEFCRISGSDTFSRLQIQNWRIALKNVCEISGYETCNREEHAVVEEVAARVFVKLHRENPFPSNVEDLIGMESHLKHLDSLMSIGATKVVRFVGIRGMGGIGKTTIAKAAYLRYFDKFEGHCFLPNVKESYLRKDPAQLQNELLRAVLNDRNFTMDFSIMERSVVQRLLFKKRVLIVLDDVNHSKQLKDLVGGYDWFGPGSRILITSRENHPLTGLKVHHIYNVKLLDNVEAMRLFCQHAFKRNHPDEAYTGLSKQMVEYANGLPLALIVLGSLLYSKNDVVWEDELSKLQKAPNSDIFNVLKASYDGLDDSQKEIFLDIACFFKGEHRGYVIDILDSCQFPAVSGIEALIDKGLITIYEDQIWIHDLVQEMGWEIVRQQSRHPSERTRLWLLHDLHHAMQSSKDKEEVEGISIDLANHEGLSSNFSIEAISKMNNLRVLRIGYLLHYRSLSYFNRPENIFDRDKLIQGSLREYMTFSHGPRSHYFWEPEEVNVNSCKESSQCKLVSLRWDRCNYTSLPCNFHPYNLTELSLRMSKIRRLWPGVKHLDKLKYVDLSYSICLTSIPDLSGAPNLESLILDGCELLQELHRSVGFLRKLIVLKLNGCSALLSLPEKISLVSLQDLGFLGCLRLTVFPDIDEPMEYIKELDFSDSNIEKLPSSIEYLSRLKKLKLESCSRLKELPITIWKLKSLEVLILSGCSRLESLPAIEEPIECMEELDLSGSNIKELHSSIEHLYRLQILKLGSCTKLREIPRAIWKLKFLKVLILNGCLKIGRFLEINEFMCSIKELDLSRSDIEGLPSSIECLSSLQTVKLESCIKLRELPRTIWKLKFLEVLKIAGCSTLRSLPEILVPLPSIKEFDLSGSNIEVLPSSIDYLSGLQTLKLESCGNLRELPSTIWKLERLTVLTLDGCSKLESLPEIKGRMWYIEKLDLSGTSIVELPSSIEYLCTLKRLKLESCTKLTELHRNIWNLESLEVLVLAGCLKFETFPEITQGMSHLREFDVSRSNIEALPSSIIENMKGLRTLKLESCTKLMELPTSICGLRCLEVLILAGCSKLRELPANICKLKSLQVLILAGCSKLEKLAEFTTPMLCIKELDLSSSDIEALPSSIEKLRELRTLKLRSCTKLRELPRTIWKLTSLEVLILAGCSKLQSFPEITSNQGKLKELDLSGTNIEELPSSIQYLNKLQILKLESCTNLRQLPLAITSWMLKSLEVLILGGCSQLKRVPEFLESMWRVRVLDLSGSNIVALSSYIHCLVSLRTLKLESCTKLRELPKTIWYLKFLEVLILAGCSSLQSFPEVVEPRGSIKELDLSCSNIEALPQPIEHLYGLQILKLESCTMLRKLPSTIWKLKDLQRLVLSGCSMLENFPEIEEPMPGLTELCLDMTAITELPRSIELLVGLTSLNLGHCKMFTKIPRTICKLKSLESLVLSGCSMLESFPEIEEDMPNLKALCLDGTAIEQLPDSYIRLTGLDWFDLIYWIWPLGDSMNIE